MCFTNNANTVIIFDQRQTGDSGDAQSDFYLGGEAGGVQKACAAGKCCFLRAWIRLGRYSGSTHQREPFPLACRKEQQQSNYYIKSKKVAGNL